MRTLTIQDGALVIETQGPVEKDINGNPTNRRSSSVVSIPAAAAERMLPQLPELEENPEVRAQLLQLIERDRAEREAREAARAVE